MRYNQLLPLIAYHKPKTIVEVGTWNGLRAMMMAEEALKHQEQVHYLGFDLFEQADDATDERELNVKSHHSLEEVKARLVEFATAHPGFNFGLVPGDTRKTLKNFDWKSIGAPDDFQPDLTFIDGGHSVETIQGDYEALKHSKIIVFDDFYTGRDAEKHGCNKIIESLDHAILPQKDPVKGGGKVQMAITPSAAWPAKQEMIVKTRNCVPDKNIQANIKYNTTLNDNVLVECAKHDELAVMISGGPSFKDHLKEIKRLSRRKNVRTVCVKHSHDPLIEAGIIPWGCMLLDPRPHVQDFIENPHPDVIYFVASMCHPSTMDRLLERKAKIWTYHAHVGAGEERAIPKGQIMISGGSTSAIRGIAVLNALGFRRFRLYGYDSCYFEKPDMKERTKTGQQKYIEVEAAGRKFWTDTELLAQAQDFDKVLELERDLDIEVIGDGMIAHVWQVKRRLLPHYEDILNG